MKGAQAAANTSRLVPRACPWRVQGRALAFLPSLGSPVPKTDMRSKPNLAHQAAFRKRSFTQRDKLNDRSLDFLFQNPLSKSSSKCRFQCIAATCYDLIAARLPI
jgi:hypothetical protein